MTFENELDRQRPRLTILARSLCRDADWADDLVQETFLKALEKKERYASYENLRPRLFVLLSKTLWKQRRRLDREVGADEAIIEEDIATDDPEFAARWQDLAAAWTKLEPEHQDALRLVFVEGSTYKAAAAKLGVSVAILKDRIFRARLVLSLISGEEVHPRVFR